MGFEALLALALGLARADDTGLVVPVPVEALPAEWVPGHAPPPEPSWPPSDIGLVTLPDNPSMRVRSPAAAVDSVQLSGVKISSRSPWPVWAEKGYLPLHLRYEVLVGRESAIQTQVSSSYHLYQSGLRLSTALDPGERRELDLLLPCFERSQSPWTARFQDGRDASEVLYGLGANQWVDGVNWSALILAPRSPALGDLERWSAATPHVLVSGALFEDMPEGLAGAAAYTSLDVAALDLSQGLPEASRLNPLLAWVRLGGTLILAGPEQAWPADLSAWMQDRFAVPPSVVGERVQAWQMGLGMIVRGPVGPWDAPEQAGMLYTAAQRSTAFSLVPDPSDDNRTDRMVPTLGKVGELPRGVLGLLLLGLAVGMGPVNLLVVRVLRRPVLLLVTTPLLAVVSSVGLVAWGITRDGLGVQWSAQSLVVLDQRSRTASGVEVRVMFAGRTLSRGLRPGPGTIFLLAEDTSPDTWSLDLRDGAEWTGLGVLPVRQKVTHVLLTDQETSRRLDVTALPSGVSVANHLGATLSGLVVRDASGRVWRSSSALEDGESFNIELSVEPAEIADTLRSIGAPPAVSLQGVEQPIWPDGLAPGTYIAWLDGFPFRDDLGHFAAEVGGRSVVLGVLDGGP